MKLALLLALIATPALAQGPAEQATRTAIARVEALDAKINAIRALDPTALDQAQALDRQRSARGPLFGIPILLKDNIEAKGPLPTSAGSLALAGNFTNRDAPLVAGLRAAGMVILGKTNLSEWANIRSSASISGWSAVGGQVRNPHALDRNACGSSSGSGAAVAAGIVAVAIGTETDGSITCPAAVNGIVGFKPTVGLVSRTHIVPISHSQDTAGPMTRDVRTAALIMNAIAGTDPADPETRDADAHRTDYAAALRSDALKGARIGVMRFAAGFSLATDAVFDAALAVLRAQGATLIEIEAHKSEGMGDAEGLVLNTELKVDLAAYLATTRAPVLTLADVIAFDTAHPHEEMPLFGQDTFEKAEKTKGLADPAYVAARAKSLTLAGAQGIDAMLAETKAIALVAPTMGPAFLIDAVNGDAFVGGGAGSYAAVAGYPHLTVPMGAVRGLPVGLSFIGPKWSDATILGLGFAYEQASHARIEPTFVRAVEDSEMVKQAFAPAK